MDGVARFRVLILETRNNYHLLPCRHQLVVRASSSAAHVIPRAADGLPGSLSEGEEAEGGGGKKEEGE